MKSKAETLPLFVLSDQTTRIIKQSVATTNRLYIEFLGLQVMLHTTIVHGHDLPLGISRGKSFSSTVIVNFVDIFENGRHGLVFIFDRLRGISFLQYQEVLL